MTYTVEHSGTCPELNRQVTITITREKNHFLDIGNTDDKRGFSCPYNFGHSCKMEESAGCPLYGEIV